MNAVLKSVKPIKAKSVVNAKADLVTIHAAELGAMAGWAAGKYDALYEQVRARKDGESYYSIAIQVYALALDATAWVSLAGTQTSYREDDEPRPAFAIRLNEERSVFSWRYLLQDLKTKAQSENVALALFDGSKLLFEYQVSPRGKGTTPKAVVNALQVQLIEAGVPEDDLGEERYR